MTTSQPALLEKLPQLRLQKRAEVEDFVDFLRTREERRLTQAAAKAAEPSFANAWDNDQDAAYDRFDRACSLRREERMRCATPSVM